jgi:hypothetical protein
LFGRLIKRHKNVCLNPEATSLYTPPAIEEINLEAALVQRLDSNVIA